MNWSQIELFEKWLPVTDFEGLYEVSDWGRIRSLARSTTPGKILGQYLRRDGYLSTALCKNGRPKSIAVHRIVADAFLGLCPPGKDVDHINGDRLDCSVPNLRYLTRRENQGEMRRRLGKWPSAKLTPHEVIEIRRLRQEGMNPTPLARLFGVNPSTIHRIVRKESWKIERKG
jgi:HNH endonuclease/NUMOD4 motif-containing protein/helix-turn-helix protein